MSSICHHAIVITCQRPVDAVQIRSEAQRRDLCVTPIVESPVNRYRSFLVGPDGSYEGWSESDDGDRARAGFIAWLLAGKDAAERINSEDHDFAWGTVEWVLVQYGDCPVETESRR